jgi:hypothetical protein
MPNLNSQNLWYRLASPDAEVQKEARDEYRDWLTNPVTAQVLKQLQAMRDVVLGMSLPPDAANGNGLSSAQRMWMLNGMQQVISRIENMDAEADLMAASAKGAAEDLVRLHDDFYSSLTYPEGSE